MKTAYSSSFIRNLKRLRGQPVFAKIGTLAFEIVPAAADLSAIANLKRLRGHNGAYRIRIGDYRVGLTFNGETVTFRRALHRKDIYRYFP